MSVRFVKTPHLPEGKVGLLALGGRYRDRLLGPLAEAGVEPLWLPDELRVDPRLAGHADLGLFHAGGTRIVTSMPWDTQKKLSDYGFEVLNSENVPGPYYPADAGLCGCLIGDYFIHDLRITDRSVLGALPEDVKRIGIRQGYAKCSICVVDKRSIITSDNGAARAAEAAGLDVLRIRPGFIELEGFEYGFIGGASFKLSRGEMAFTGRMDTHPDRDAIEHFFRCRGLEPVLLTEEVAFDIGSALPLTEAAEDEAHLIIN